MTNLLSFNNHGTERMLLHMHIQCPCTPCIHTHTHTHTHTHRGFLCITLTFYKLSKVSFHRRSCKPSVVSRSMRCCRVEHWDLAQHY